ncbi:MAG: LytTR family DNA-binding domain-containing protein [Bacteroidota bacterium]
MNNKVYNCLVVDDDNLAKTILIHFIKQYPSLSLITSLSNGLEALDYLIAGEQSIDILFLDVEMPEMSGLQLLKALPTKPATILITSDRNFASDAFDLEVVDFIVKPVEYVRFTRAVDKVIETLSSMRKNASDQDIFMKVDNKMVKIVLDDILYIEALSDYIIVVTDKHKHIVYSTMKSIEEKLASESLLRVHRSYIINLKKVEAIEDNSVIIKGSYVPISKSYQEDFFRRIRKL